MRHWPQNARSLFHFYVLYIRPGYTYNVSGVQLPGSDFTRDVTGRI